MRSLVALAALCTWTCLAWGYYIESFEVRIRIYDDATIRVEERIAVDFDGEAKHGIYRDITYKYTTASGNRYNLRLRVESVTDGLGKARKYKVFRHGRDLRVRIGDPKRYVSGRQVYVIRYFVKRAVKFFEDHDELWWEVTGHRWECPIHSASVLVQLPPETDLDRVRAKCFTGRYGSREQDCQYTVTADGVEFVTGYISPGEGLSVVVGVPKGVIKPPSTIAELGWFLADNWLWVLCFPVPFLVFALLLRKWYVAGRDPIRGAPIMVRYHPPEELLPAEMGTVMDERADISDITATIVDLAVKGFLKIVETKSEKLLFFTSKDYALVLLKDIDRSDLSEFEKKLLRGLFEVGSNKGLSPADIGVPEGKELIFVSTLKEKFYRNLAGLQSKLYRDLSARGYFPRRPDKVRSFYLQLGVVFFIVGVALTVLSKSFAFLWAGLPSAILFFFFAPIMPRKTKKGVAAMLHAKGFEEFVRRAERDRIKRLAKDDPTVFERLLPYAMVLGCADEWVEKFEGIFEKPPDWYVGTSPMNTVVFVDSLGRAVGAIGRSMSSRPRGASSGGSGFSGGFSGGGFGGGGGGAW